MINHNSSITDGYLEYCKMKKENDSKKIACGFKIAKEQLKEEKTKKTDEDDEKNSKSTHSFQADNELEKK